METSSDATAFSHHLLSTIKWIITRSIELPFTDQKKKKTFFFFFLLERRDRYNDHNNKSECHKRRRGKKKRQDFLWGEKRRSFRLYLCRRGVFFSLRCQPKEKLKNNKIRRLWRAREAYFIVSQEEGKKKEKAIQI